MRPTRAVVVGLSLVMVAIAPILAIGQPGSQTPGTTVLRITGGSPNPLSLTAEAFATLARETVSTTDREGRSVTFEGVRLSTLLRTAKAPLGDQLRGPRLADYLLVTAADGYRVVLALPEVDEAFTDRVVLLADRRDGRPLSTREGPLMVVIPAERRHSRWIRQVLEIGVRRAD
jgi:hypothetical protein